MTPDDLKRVANAPGYGIGQRVRDRLAAEAECKALLPDPGWVPAVVASCEARSGLPMCHFGNDPTGDWSIFYAERPLGDSPFGLSAEDDARIVAAIINAYRLGLIGRATIGL
jgi:hypothetical protein